MRDENGGKEVSQDTLASGKRIQAVQRRRKIACSSSMTKHIRHLVPTETRDVFCVEPVPRLCRKIFWREQLNPTDDRPSLLSLQATISSPSSSISSCNITTTKHDDNVHHLSRCRRCKPSWSRTSFLLSRARKTDVVSPDQLETF